MVDRYQGAERRKFIRYQYAKSIQYKKVILSDDKIVALRLVDAFSENLTAGGIMFTTNQPPEISNMVALELDYGETTCSKEIEKRVLMLNNKPVGRVVRIEDIGDGQYNVAVAFLTPPEHLAREIRHLLGRKRWHRFVTYVLIGIAILFITLLAFSINFIYKQEKKLYLPDKAILLTPTAIDIAYEDEYCKTEDGETINAWFIPANGAKTTIIYCHGNEGNIADRLTRINFFHNLGVNLLIFDYRGYGKSSGKPTEEGLYKDTLAVYDYLISRKDIDKDKIIALGVSLGGPVAAELCLKRKVRVLVLESSFVSLAIEAQDLYPFLPIQFLLFEKYDTLAKIKNIHIPKLVVHGLDDEIVLYKHARFLYDAAPPPKTFLQYHGGHSDDVFKLSNTYKDALKKFFHDNNIM